MLVQFLSIALPICSVMWTFYAVAVMFAHHID